MIRVNLAKIKSIPFARVPFRFAEPLDTLAAGYTEFSLPGDLLITGEVSNQSIGQYQVAFAYQGEISQTCSRCGQPFTKPLQGECTAHFAVDPLPDEDGEEVVWPVEDDSIALDEAVLNEIYFALPMQPLCKADCKGLCPVCGQNLNCGSCSCQEQVIDPRWEKLKNLLKEV